MRSIFCGNLESDARQSDLERLFRKYGKVERVDMKSGFAFINMEEERDADDAIRRLDRFEFGRTGRRLRVEWTKQERGNRRSFSPKRSSSARTVPSKTLFVINFDPMDTKISDLEKHFDAYGRILNVRIRRNFAFVQYESQEDATKALEEMHMSKFMDRVISVKYAVRDDDDKRRGRDASPERRGGRDASPEGRGGRDSSPERRGNRDASPERRGGRDASRERRGNRDASPERRGGRDASSERRGGRDVSPDRRGGRDASSERRCGRDASPDRRGGRDVSPERRGGRDVSLGRYGQGRSPGLYRKDRGSPDYGHGPVPKPRTEPSHSPISRDRSRS